MRILLAILLLIAIDVSAQTVTFGPIALGKPFPDIPECSTGTPDTCLDTCCDRKSRMEPGSLYMISNLLYPDDEGGFVTILESCNAKPDNCPVGQVEATVSWDMCLKVLGRLKTKLGTPAHRSQPVQNAFGAKWVQDYFTWSTKAGDQVRYSMHTEFDDNKCSLSADTREFRKQAAANKEAPEVKF